jgi:hypothetical protein
MFKNFNLDEYRFFEFYLKHKVKKICVLNKTYRYQYFEISRISKIQSKSSKKEHLLKLQEDFRENYDNCYLEIPDSSLGNQSELVKTLSKINKD